MVPRRLTSSRTLPLTKVHAQHSSSWLMAPRSQLPSTTSSSTTWRSLTRDNQCWSRIKTEGKSVWSQSSACWTVSQIKSETTQSPWEIFWTRWNRILNRKWLPLQTWSRSYSRWRNGKSGTSKSKRTHTSSRAGPLQLLNYSTKKVTTSSCSLTKDSSNKCLCITIHLYACNRAK